MNLLQLMYTSTANPELTFKELDEMLAKARRFNRENNITGMLVFSQGTILQVIEGTSQQVNALYARIQKDPRHRDVELVQAGTIQERMFSRWTMNFVSLDENFTPERRSVLLKHSAGQFQPSKMGSAQCLELMVALEPKVAA